MEAETLELPIIEAKAEKQSVPVKESWYNAALQGNILWPQDFIPGITYLTLSAAMKDPPNTWADFFASEMNTDQLKKMGKIMSTMHHHKGIPLATQPHARGGDDVMATNELQGLWGAEKDQMVQVLLKYINMHGDKKVPMPDQEEDHTDYVGYIDDYFSNPDNA